MKKLDTTILESINHLLISHPELRTPLFELIVKGLKIRPADLFFLYFMNIDLIKKSRSQLRQDLFVLFQTKFKKNGYFVEFGATDGIELSNSFLLEKEYGWKGILAEPALKWHEDLIKNRTAHIGKTAFGVAQGISWSSMRSKQGSCLRWINTAILTTTKKRANKEKNTK